MAKSGTIGVDFRFAFISRKVSKNAVRYAFKAARILQLTRSLSASKHEL